MGAWVDGQNPNCGIWPQRSTKSAKNSGRKCSCPRMHANQREWAELQSFEQKVTKQTKGMEMEALFVSFVLFCSILLFDLRDLCDLCVEKTGLVTSTTTREQPAGAASQRPHREPQRPPARHTSRAPESRSAAV